jgi:biofilm PGA synthesis lipoprotein PgaB
MKTAKATFLILLFLLVIQSSAAATRAPFPAPPVSPTRSEIALWQPLPSYSKSMPVLAYHSIGPSTWDGYTISQDQFALQMDMLHRAGFHSVSAEQYRLYLHGQLKTLPSRPILITFDDGKLGSFTGADSVLAKYGFRASMFVIAGAVSHTTYLTWEELRAMRASGRWDLQEHAGYGHTQIWIAPGKKGPYYANERLSMGKMESFSSFQMRVQQDLVWGLKQMRVNLPGFIYSPLFAVPYSNYGEHSSNDPKIAPYMQSLLSKRFQGTFLDEHASWSRYNTSHTLINRLAIHSSTTADSLYSLLKKLQPSGG